MLIEANTEEGLRISRVLLDGKDVTELCCAINTDEGWIEKYVRTESGKMPVVNGAIAREKVYGTITIIYGGGS